MGEVLLGRNSLLMGLPIVKLCSKMGSDLKSKKKLNLVVSLLIIIGSHFSLISRGHSRALVAMHGTPKSKRAQYLSDPRVKVNALVDQRQ